MTMADFMLVISNNNYECLNFYYCKIIITLILFLAFYSEWLSKIMYGILPCLLQLE